MRTEEARPVRLEDYRPPDWLVETVELDVDTVEDDTVSSLFDAVGSFIAIDIFAQYRTYRAASFALAFTFGFAFVVTDCDCVVDVTRSLTTTGNLSSSIGSTTDAGENAASTC